MAKEATQKQEIKIGDYVVLKGLQLLQGESSLDVPQFIVVDKYKIKAEKSQRLIITDRTTRQFAVNEKDVRKIK